MAEVRIEVCDGDMFLTYDGVKVARRGSKAFGPVEWISLEPGFTVIDGEGGIDLVVERDGVKLQ
jgi:hypothetical protein